MKIYFRGNMAPLTGFRSAAPLPGCTSLSVGAGLDPLASVKGAKLEKLVALPVLGRSEHRLFRCVRFHWARSRSDIAAPEDGRTPPRRSPPSLTQYKRRKS